MVLMAFHVLAGCSNIIQPNQIFLELDTKIKAACYCAADFCKCWRGFSFL